LIPSRCLKISDGQDIFFHCARAWRRPERRGQTEAAVDLAGLAGMYPAGVICEIVNEDDNGARARPHSVLQEAHPRMVTVADLGPYRLDLDLKHSFRAIDGLLPFL